MSDHSKLPPHIGHIVRQTLKSQGRTVTWLAQQLPCDRSNVYKIFAKRTLDTELLLTLSKVLGVDFFQIYSSFLKKWCRFSHTFVADEALQKIICCRRKSIYLQNKNTKQVGIFFNRSCKFYFLEGLIPSLLLFVVGERQVVFNYF